MIPNVFLDPTTPTEELVGRAVVKCGVSRVDVSAFTAALTHVCPTVGSMRRAFKNPILSSNALYPRLLEKVKVVVKDSPTTSAAETLRLLHQCVIMARRDVSLSPPEPTLVAKKAAAGVVSASREEEKEKRRRFLCQKVYEDWKRRDTERLVLKKENDSGVRARDRARRAERDQLCQAKYTAWAIAKARERRIVTVKGHSLSHRESIAEARWDSTIDRPLDTSNCEDYFL